MKRVWIIVALVIMVVASCSFGMRIEESQQHDAIRGLCILVKDRPADFPAMAIKLAPVCDEIW